MKHYPSYTKNPMYRYLLLLVIAVAIGFQGWRTLFNNYAVDVVGINAFQMGVIQSVREIPGFLTFFVVYLLIFCSEYRFAAISAALLGLGVLLTGFFPSHTGLIGTTILMSVGMHFFETTKQSLTLQYFESRRIPNVLASFAAYSALANISIGILIWVLSKFLPLHDLFYIIGGLLILVSLFALTQKPVETILYPQKKHLLFRKRYWLFYLLNFFSGARRQIFVVFAVFIMVEKYHFSVAYITALFVLNNIITYFLSPIVGRAIGRFGERFMLTVEYGTLLFVFAGYALIENSWAATIFYIIDNVFFSFAIALNTYFRKQADPADIAPSMAVGFTINHISSVVVPIFGGILWMYNWRIPFIVGSVIALCSLILSQFIKNQ